MSIFTRYSKNIFFAKAKDFAILKLTEIHNEFEIFKNAYQKGSNEFKDYLYEKGANFVNKTDNILRYIGNKAIKFSQFVSLNFSSNEPQYSAEFSNYLSNNVQSDLERKLGVGVVTIGAILAGLIIGAIKATKKNFGYFIYAIFNRLTNEILYIGQSHNIKNRETAYLSIKEDDQKLMHIHKKILRIGVEYINVRVIDATATNNSELNDKEREFIAKYDLFEGDGYNLTPGGTDYVFNFNEKNVQIHWNKYVKLLETTGQTRDYLIRNYASLIGTSEKDTFIRKLKKLEFDSDENEILFHKIRQLEKKNQINNPNSQINFKTHNREQTLSSLDSRSGENYGHEGFLDFFLGKKKQIHTFSELKLDREISLFANWHNLTIPEELEKMPIHIQTDANIFFDKIKMKFPYKNSKFEQKIISAAVLLIISNKYNLYLPLDFICQAYLKKSDCINVDYNEKLREMKVLVIELINNIAKIENLPPININFNQWDLKTIPDWVQKKLLEISKKKW